MPWVRKPERHFAGIAPFDPDQGSKLTAAYHVSNCMTRNKNKPVPDNHHR
jgi:hypothetical protein